MHARHLLIHGLVHGVGFRWSLCAEAGKHGVTGWVRNRNDGTVEAMIQGPKAALDALTAWAHSGPPAARVERVVATEQPPGTDAETLRGFEQLPTL